MSVILDTSSADGETAHRHTTSAPELVHLSPQCEIWRPFVLRSAGFPFDLLNRISLDEDTIEQIDLLDRHEMELNEAQQDLKVRLLPELLDVLKSGSTDRARPLRKDLNRLNKQAQRGEPLQGVEGLSEALAAEYGTDAGLSAWAKNYGALQNALRPLQRSTTSAFESAFADSRRALWDQASQSDFTQAVFLSNANLADLFTRLKCPEGNERNTKVRQRENTLWMYLQRFASKNETNSFFGPLNYGRIDQNADNAPALDLSYQAKRRVAYAAEWLVAEILDKISKEPDLKAILPVVLQGPRRRHRETDWIHEGLSQRKLAQVLGTSEAFVEQRLAPLVEQGFAARRLTVPSARVDQLSALIEALLALEPATTAETRVRADWLAFAYQINDARMAFAEADEAQKRDLMERAERLFSHKLGGAARRNEGRMFRTRQLFYEEGFGGANLHLAQSALDPITEDLEALALACRVNTHWLHKIHMARSMAQYDLWFPGRERVRFDQVAKRMMRVDAGEAEAALISDETRALVRAHDGFRANWFEILERVSATEEWPRDLQQQLASDLELDPVWFMSPDLLIAESLAGGERQLQWVLGEVHHGITMDGWMLALHQSHDELRGQLDAIVQERAGQDERLAANLVLARHMKTSPQVYPALNVELTGTAPNRTSAKSLGLADLHVKRERERLILLDPQSQREVSFLPPAFGFDPMAYRPFELFSYPILRLPEPLPSERDFSPRLGRHAFIFKRAEWTIAAHDLAQVKAHKALMERFRAMRQLASERFISQFSFVKIESEPKPILMDLENPLSVEAVLGAARGDGALRLSEMLPDGDRLWFSGTDGRSYTSELRMLMVGGASS
ncbi:lantibiotic dehydratase [Pseudovibrio sp. SPO723]|uniref:lantibiotic dehydratase n=1 Tax=Nesiotobacter zosterae TaxID=392721 RepID=UPI0029C54EF8|nr:lantibiotic dehydratase [Pseudovibrio sp. SPO723]MDX5594275.1 lantibiotic dehydratase [Pseudovibrio sp. SPO723]